MDREGNLLIEDGKPKYGEINDTDFENIGNGKQIGVKTDEGVIVSEGFEARYNNMSVADKAKALDELKSPDFELSGSQMVGTIAMAIAGPLDNRTI